MLVVSLHSLTFLLITWNAVVYQLVLLSTFCIVEFNIAHTGSKNAKFLILKPKNTDIFYIVHVFFQLDAYCRDHTNNLICE